MFYQTSQNVLIQKITVFWDYNSDGLADQKGLLEEF